MGEAKGKGIKVSWREVKMDKTENRRGKRRQERRTEASVERRRKGKGIKRKMVER